MNSRRILNLNSICISLLILLVCSKWFIEGILDKPILEAILLLVLVGILALKRNFRLKKSGLIWLPFICNIFFSLTISQSTVGLWGRGIVMVFITCLAMLIDDEVVNYEKPIKLVVVIGIINGAFVILHWFFNEVFEQFYYPLLNDTAKQTYNLYTRNGYYFGLLYNPQEPAYLIVIAITAVILYKFVFKKRGIRSSILVICLTIPLLLTGKKGICVIAIISLVVMILILFGSKKQWFKIIIFLTVILGVAMLFIYMVINHSELVFFNRFREFFLDLATGGDVSSGRLYLYEIALKEWKEHMMFGIGWRHFNALTVEKYHLTQYHEVNCDYLQWLCETGIVGFCCNIMVFLLMQIRSSFNCRKMLKIIISDKEKWLLLLTGYIQVFTLLYAFIEIPFEDIIIFSVYILSCIVQNSIFIRRYKYYEQRE